MNFWLLLCFLLFCCSYFDKLITFPYFLQHFSFLHSCCLYIYPNYPKYRYSLLLHKFLLLLFLLWLLCFCWQFYNIIEFFSFYITPTIFSTFVSSSLQRNGLKLPQIYIGIFKKVL